VKHWDFSRRTGLSKKYIVYERGWNVDYYEVEAESKEAAIEAVNKSEVDISYSDFSNTEVGTINADAVSCSEHTRGCLHGECECECEF
jgi:hypothetical protein